MPERLALNQPILDRLLLSLEPCSKVWNQHNTLADSSWYWGAYDSIIIGYGTTDHNQYNQIHGSFGVCVLILNDIIIVQELTVLVLDVVVYFWYLLPRKSCYLFSVVKDIAVPDDARKSFPSHSSMWHVEGFQVTSGGFQDMMIGISELSHC